MKSATHGTTRFHYYSSFTGPVIVNVASTAFHDEYWPADIDGPMSRPIEIPYGLYQIEIPAEDIMALVLDQLRNKLIRRLENAEGEELKALMLGMVGYKSARLETEDEPDLSPPEMIGHNRREPQGLCMPGM